MFSIYEINVASIAQKSPLYAQFVAAHYAASRMGAKDALPYIMHAAICSGQGDTVGARANMTAAREICREHRVAHLISSALTGRTVADASALEVAV
jgi:hypothetical protein